ncbi:MAG: hypothetical protein JNM56_26685 [Planctomycetia bacterium]|nr:hypothetical protein [Planctomycetia bacterium]
MNACFRSLALGLLLILGGAVLAPASSSEDAPKAQGYWQFVESFRNEYPVEKRNKARLYELRWGAHRLATRVGNMVGPGGNIMKEPVAERTTTWTWTTLPHVLVPGERLPVKLAFTGSSARGDGPTTQMSAGFVRAAPKPAPNDKVDQVNNALGIFWGSGVTGLKGLAGLDDGKAEPHVLDGTILTPPFGYAESEKTRQVDFAVIIGPGGSFRVATLYRYRWVDGAPPPADKRGEPVPDPGDGSTTATKPPDVPGTGVTPPTPGTGTAPPATPEPANVNRFTVQAGVRRAKPGETVQVPIYLLNPSGVANLNTTVAYTPTVATAQGKPLRGNVLGNALFEANAAEAGLARVGFAGAKPVTDSGILAHVAFRAVGKPGDHTVLRVAVTTANGTDGKPLTADTIDGSVIIVGESGKIPGDHDGDGLVTAGDALSALKMSVKLLPEDKNLDLDHDGHVTSNDARLILVKAVGK